MSGTIVVDRIESDASYASSINIASPVIVSNTFVVPAGTVSAPTITPTGDPNTGIFFPAADNIGFATGGTIRGRWTTDGLCFGSDTAAANALDDYEEGDWTVQLQDTNSNNAVMEAAFTTASYVKIGRQVTVTGACYTSSISGLSGDIRISGLPFAIGNNNKFRGAGATSSEQLLNISAGQKLSLRFSLGGTTMSFYISDSADGGSALQASEWSSDGFAEFTATYFT